MVCNCKRQNALQFEQWMHECGLLPSLEDEPAENPEEEMGANEVKTFKFKGIVTDEKKNPWFIAGDVCGILGYKNPWDAVSRHCKHSRKTTLVKHEVGKGGQDIRTVIPESDLYRLVMRSNMEVAESFQDWVVEEVLPQWWLHSF